MNTRIVSAVGRGYYHGTRTQLRHDVLDPLFEKLRKISEDLSLSKDLREWAFFMAYRLKPIMGGSIGDTFENDLMKLIFNAVAIANIADNAASSPLTSVFVALHSADPGESGTAATSEIGYTSYARATCARDTSTATRWVVTNNSAAPNQNIDFAAGTGGSGTVTHFSITTVVTVGNASKILFSGTVTPNIVTGNGVTPRLTTGTSCTLD